MTDCALGHERAPECAPAAAARLARVFRPVLIVVDRSSGAFKLPGIAVWRLRGIHLTPRTASRVCTAARPRRRAARGVPGSLHGRCVCVDGLECARLRALVLECAVNRLLV